MRRRTPVKDGLATKIRPTSSSLAGCIYFPLAAGGLERLRFITGELERWLRACGPEVVSASAVCGPGESVSLAS
jgi:hypothetical protein